MKTVNGTLVSIFVVLGVFSVPAMAQKTLYIVDSEGNALEQVDLDQGSTVDLLADGVRAQASGYSCSAEVSCDADVAIEEFSVSHDGSTYTAGDEFTIEQGQCFNVSWSTRGPWAVEGIGLSGAGWASADKGVSGTQQICTGNLSLAVHDVTLRPYNCGGNGDTCGVEKLQTVFADVVEATSEPEPSPEGCENTPSLADQSNWAPANDVVWGSRDPDPNSYEEVFGAPLGGSSASTIDFYLAEGRFASMQFHTPSNMNSSSEGAWGFQEHKPTFSGGSENKLISISSCPGVFDPQYIAGPDCIKELGALGGTFRFVGPDHDWSSFQCELQPGKTYYLNIVYTDSKIGETPVRSSTCTGSLGCGNEMQPTGFTGF